MPDLERVQRLTPTTLRKQWTEDGAAVDPGTVTVGVVNAAGTVIVTPGTATGGATTAPRTFNLTTTHTALLDRLTVTWTSTLKGTLVSYVEVVGGFLFSLADMRVLLPNATTYPNAKIQDMRTTVEQAIEEQAGFAFVPRYERETVNGSYGVTLPLKWKRVRTIRTVTMGGADVTPVNTILGLREGYAYYETNWTFGYANIVMGYEHGLDYPPGRISDAALQEAKYRLTAQNSPTDARAITTTYDGGTVVLQQPGRGGKHFFLPETDEAVGQYATVNIA